MLQILDIAADQFYFMGISTEAAGYGVVRNNFHNVPATMPESWQYPTPAPTNPEQYFLAAS
jgi:peptide/nickel transport system substrate-binding protein